MLIASPFCKFAHGIESVQRIPYYVEMAKRNAHLPVMMSSGDVEIGSAGAAIPPLRGPTLRPLLRASTLSCPGSHRFSSIARKNLAATSEQNHLCRIHDIRRATERLGPGEVRRSIGMRRLPAISLDPMKFVQAFAAGLRAAFADAACAPVPEYLAALMRQLDGDRNEHSGEGGE